MWSVRDKYMVDSLFHSPGTAGQQDSVSASASASASAPRANNSASAVEDGSSVGRSPYCFSPDTLTRVSNSISVSSGLGLQSEPSADGIVINRPSQTFVKGAVDESDFLHTEFYLTRARSESDFLGANIQPEFQPCLRMGRPNVSLKTFSPFC